MDKVLNIYKPIGQTPYQTVQLVKKIYPDYGNEKIGYAGRLDPMASGVLLLLVGEANKRKKEFEMLPKKYTFEAVFGVQTDSYDLLGKIDGKYHKYQTDELKNNIQKLLKSYFGEIKQFLPPYSAFRLNGKPLYHWARRGKLSDINNLTKVVTIYSLKLISTDVLNDKTLHQLIKNNIAKINGDFRQKEILKLWHDFFQQNINLDFFTAKFTLHCSSGTYVRSIVNELGKKLKCGATTLSILRTDVGEYNLTNSLRL